MEDNRPNTSRENQPQKRGRNRKRPFGESSKIAYSSISFEARESTGRPRSPHRFFSSSHTATVSKDTEKGVPEDTQKDQNAATSAFNINQVVHHHVNGLCIVTAGEKLPPSIKSIQFVAREAPACSNGEKRKRQAKMLKGGNVEHSVTPSTVIAQLELENGETIPLYACVWGNILELNQSLTPEVLVDDPLLDGYLAVILPSGNFPPKKEKSEPEDLEDLDAIEKGKTDNLESNDLENGGDGGEQDTNTTN
jgi:hypothetical protein